MNAIDIKRALEQDGFCIIPDVLTTEECDAGEAGIWEAVQTLSSPWEKPISRDDASTWRGFHDLYPLKHNLLQQHGVATAQASWDVRQNPRVAGIFADLWECSTEDLLVSFDGFALGLPPEITNKGWHCARDDLHVDQNPATTALKCYQGYVACTDIDSADFTTLLIPRSHLAFADMADHFRPTASGDWLVMTPDMIGWYASRGMEPIRLAVPRGAMVIWDSRTIHCGTKPLKGRPAPNIRAIVYVCYLPRALASAKQLARKRKAFDDGATCSHNPIEFRRFAFTPRTYGGQPPVIQRLPAPVLTPLGLRLAGFDV